MTKQIAVKLPDRLLERVDEQVGRGVVESRAEAVRRGLALLLDRIGRDAVDEAYREAYRRCPETEEEVEEAYRRGRASIAEEPWERWW